jgi:hypothetical protein
MRAAIAPCGGGDCSLSAAGERRVGTREKGRGVVAVKGGFARMCWGSRERPAGHGKGSRVRRYRQGDFLANSALAPIRGGFCHGGSFVAAAFVAYAIFGDKTPLLASCAESRSRIALV